MIILRDYQRAAIDAIKRAWADGHQDTLCVLATGGGKTAVLLSLLHEELGPGERALIIAHTRELVEQPRDRLLSYYPEWTGKVGIVMAENDECDKQITVATVQTLASEARLARLLEHGPPDYLVIDECFPAGTLVDCRPIETLRIGDTVRAYNEATQRTERRRITRLYKRPAPRNLIRIVAGGRELVCTWNHPILVNGAQWLPAACVQPGDFLEDAGNGDQPENLCCVRSNFHAAQLEQHHDADLLRGVSSGPARGTAQAHYAALHDLRQAGRALRPAWSRNGAQGPRVLLGAVQTGLSQSALRRAYGRDESSLCQSAHDGTQSHAQPGSARQDERDAADHRPSAVRSGWQRETGDAPATDARRCARLADGSQHSHGQGALFGISDLLQGRPGAAGVTAGGRGRRLLARRAGAAGAGSEEGRTSRSVRVDRVEILERASVDGPDELCPDGYVYNLKVEGLHTYTANGFVVHNCHHSTSDTYASLVTALKAANPDLKHLGVTATPLRTDGNGLRSVYQHVAYKAGIKELVSAGWLVPPRWLAIQTGISLAGVAVRYADNGKDYSQRQLANVFETANCYDLVVESHKKYAQDRRALAFTVSVDGAYQLAETFNRAGIPAAAADGTTPKPERANILRAFRNGEIQVLCNMNLFTEGLDVPEVACIHQVRPTQSDLIYTQIIGRALRPVPGKQDALILDYAPVEARNIVMAGDVLGVPAKKEVYLKEQAEQGEVIGGFTFDGSVKWLNGSPMELISRSLDYLNASPWVWDRGSDGWMILPLGTADDQIDRTLAMSPLADHMALYLIAKRPDEQFPRAWLFKAGSFEELSALAEEYAAKRGQAVLAQKAKRWRKQPPSDAQILYAKRLKVYQPGMSRGDCAAAITRALTLRTLRHGGFLAAQQ